MALLAHQFGRREAGATQLRAEALRLAWAFDDLATADSHSLRVRFSCSTRIADTDADRRMFSEVFLGSRTAATVEDVTAYFATALRAAVAQVAATRPAEQWVGGATDAMDAMQTALTAAANPVAFACGLEILPPFQVEMASSSLERARVEAVERARAEERVAGQVQYLQRAGELLGQFNQLREQMPQLTPGQILQQISAPERGSTLQSLLMASAKQSARQTLYAVAGPYLVRIDTSALPPKCELINLPTEAGPLRSVQPGTINGRRMLLVGARSGMMVVPPQSPAETQVYLDPKVQTQLGFNQAAVLEGTLYASHSEAGVVGWKLGEPGEPFARYHANPDPVGAAGATGVAGAAEVAASMPMVSVGASPSLMTTGSRSVRSPGARNVCVLDASHLIYSVGNGPIVLDVSSDQQPRALPAESQAEIVAILPDEDRMLIVHADSTIAVLSRDTRQITDRQRRAGRVCAAAALPWLGAARMLLVDTDGPIDCVGSDDPLITQYVSPHRSLRVLAASVELVAAVSSDRQRVVLWQSWDGRAPVAEVHVTGVARHRVADISFV